MGAFAHEKLSIRGPVREFGDLNLTISGYSGKTPQRFDAKKTDAPSSYENL